MLLRLPVSVAAVLAALLAAGALRAAPVAGEGGDAVLAPRDDPAAASAAAPAHTAVRTLDRSLQPDTSTGNKHFDLLLDLQGRPDAQPRRVAPISAASASAAAAALAELRARAARGPDPQDVPGDPADRPGADPAAARTGLPSLGFGGAGPQQIDPHKAELQPRRGWSGPFDGGGDRRPAGATGDPDAVLLSDYLRLVADYLRDNGAWLLGLGGLLALIGVALKAYSRRV